MAHIIAFANQKKGGTMTMVATASVLTQQGYQVLLLDLDAQRNLDMVGEILKCLLWSFHAMTPLPSAFSTC